MKSLTQGLNSSFVSELRLNRSKTGAVEPKWLLTISCSYCMFSDIACITLDPK